MVVVILLNKECALLLFKKISNGVFVTFHYDLGSFSFNTNIEIAQTLEIHSHENNQEIKV